MNKIILGIGMFALWVICGAAHAATEWSAQDYDLYSGDFNGDGATDILYIAKDPSKPSGIALADSTGAISIGWQTWASNFLGINWSGNNYKVIVADFNGDGKADIFLQSVVPANNYLLLTSSAGFVVGISQTVPNSVMGLIWSADQHHIIAGDFNGDGHADLFLQATSTSGTDAVVFADANGMFTSASPAQTWVDGYLGFKWSTFNANVFAGDFDGNGRADLLIQAKPIMVMIDYDVPFPVPTYPPNMNGVVLSQGGTTPFSAVGVQAWSRMTNGVDWSPLTNNIVIGTNSGGKAVVILQGLHAGETSYELVGNATGAIFPATATAMTSNVGLTADSFHLIAGNFGKSSTTTGLYYQTLTAAGTNYLTDSVGATTTATAQNPTTDTGTVPALAVGRTPGTFAVSNSGTATYSIPIVVPPGVEGIEPKLAIAYQSGSSNGFLGVGWNLTGLSEIQRCKKTLLEDGVNGTPQLVDADDYCLDGNKLRYSGGAAYGAPGSTYQPEIDNFTRVTAYSNGGNPALGPGYFVAQTKDGLSYEYGRTGNAYDNPLTPSEWLLDKVSDRYGNSMIIWYANNSSGVGQEPTFMAYSDGAGVSREVIFNYETRATTDVISRASMSGPHRSTDRLKSIQTTYNGATVRQYDLSYRNTGSSPNTRLSAVQECDGSGNCLLPTTISWQDGQVGVGLDNTVAIGSLSQYAIPMDVNGDGRSDVVYPSPGATGTWMVMLASASGGYGTPINTGIAHNGNYVKALPLDYNADGRMDLLVPNASNNWQILQSAGTGTAFTGFTVITTTFAATGAGGQAWVADVNGDGYQDLVYADASATHLMARLNSATGLSASPITVYTVPANAIIANPSSSSYYAFNLASNTQGDFNGDGRTDLMIGLSVVGVPTPKILISTGTAYVDSGYVFSDSIVNGASTILSTWRAVDANADGFADIAFGDSSGVWKIAYGGPGSTAFSQTVSSSISLSPGSATLGFAVSVADWDGDGRPDILWATAPPNTSGPWQWNRSTGDTLSAALGGMGSMVGVTNTAITTAQLQTAFADVNGDGLQDVVWGDKSGNWHYRLRQGIIPDLVTSISDGFGNSVSWVYAPLTDSSVYTKGNGAAFPNVDLQVPFYVVKQVTASDGIGGYFNISESYSGARLNFQGRGFEGFATRTETDNRTGISTTTTFNQAFPFVGLVASTNVTQSSGKVISHTDYAYTDLVTNATAFSDRHFPYAGTVTTTTNEVNPGDPTDGQGIVQLKTVTLVDSFGTPTQITETTYDLTNASAVARTTVKSFGVPSNDVTNWCLGFVTTQTVQNTVPNLPAQTRTVQYVKDTDATKCRVYQKIIEPNDVAPFSLKLTTTYLYDAFGHVSNETVAGAGIPNRVTQTSYGTPGVFALTVTNAAGEVTQKTFDYAQGMPLTLTDANGVLVSWTYDSFGRKTKETRPDGTYTLWSLYACTVENAYCGDGLLRYQSQEQVYGTAGLIRYSVHLFDSLGRDKYSQAQVLTGAMSTVATVYDNFGRVKQRSRPYFSGDGVFFTTSFYDILGRVISETRQVNQANTSTQSVAYGYKRLQHTYTDANGKSTTKLHNALAQVVQVTDAIGAITQYQYDPFGNLLSTKDAAGNQIINAYNIRGFKTQTADPDLGTWNYSYYPTGELNTRKDSKAQMQTLVYDGIGRMVTRTEPEGTTTWSYGTTATTSATNRNVSKLIGVTSPGGYSETYGYDNLGRALTVTTVASAVTYVVTNAYDPSTGLLSTITYPTSTTAVSNSRFEVQYGYSYGQLSRITDFYTPTTIYWQANTVDASGRSTDEQFANGLHTSSQYDAVTGLLAARTTGTSAQIQNLSYQWDKVGNLLERKDSTQHLTEDFTSYDGLNRLLTSTLNGVTNLSLTYDPQGIGNIATKSDIGTYSYAAACGTVAHVHAVTTAGSNSYCYDANGNMVTRNGSSISWYSYNLPNQINQGGNYSQFSYGAGGNRYQEVSVVAAGGPLPAGTETTVFINGMFEKVTKPSGVVEFKHYIIAGNSPIAIRTLRSNSVNDVRYLHKDHLGSIDSITDETGALVAHLSYDAFGKRRSGASWTASPSPTDWTNIAGITHRGFTSHEQLDDVGLVHMNGRVYDPTIGRFISADPTIQVPFMSQNLNRYSYVGNNPLSMVDLTGYGFFSDLWDTIVGFVRFAAPIIIAFVAYAYGAPYFSQLLATTECLAPGTITLAGATVAGGVSAALSAAAAGEGWRASLRAGLWGAIGAWTGFQVREGLQDWSEGRGAGLVSVHQDAGGITVDDIGTPSDHVVFVNGMKNNFDLAVSNALKMSGGDDVDLFYNPSHGFIADLTESIAMKFTGTSALGNQLAQILQDGDYNLIVGHSQGTLIISNALNTLAQEGYTFDNGIAITYYGAAANQWVAASLSQSVGATFNGVYDSPFDLVGNVVGNNTLNPFRFVGSILAAPMLFMGPGISPHSCYPACAVPP